MSLENFEIEEFKPVEEIELKDVENKPVEEIELNEIEIIEVEENKPVEEINEIELKEIELKGSGRKKGQKATKPKYKLFFFNINKGEYEYVNSFAILNEISIFLKKYYFDISEQLIKNIVNKRYKTHFLKVEYI